MPHQDPDLAEESLLYAQGYRLIAGIDEVGRGALAGDVVAAAVILPPDPGLLQRLRGVRDSKQLLPRQRSILCTLIQAEAIAIGLGRVSPQEIDRIGIVQATRLAMQMAVANLMPQPEFLLIDAVRLPGIAIPQKAIVRGDVSCLSIAAASVVAKVTRDAWMTELDSQFPGYGFAHNKGYGTEFHRQALLNLRPSPVHRHSYAPVRQALVAT